MKDISARRVFQSQELPSADILAFALGGSWHGYYGTARCPAHDDREPSLGILDVEGRAWITCHAGCDWPTIRAALVRRGLWPGRATHPMRCVPLPGRYRPQDRNGDAARRIWRETRSAGGTIVEGYLRGRGIDLPIPSTIRFHPSLRFDGQESSAMVAAVEHIGASGVVAVHRTFLAPAVDGAPPVRLDRRLLGPSAGGAVRLAPAAEHMGVAEGIETGLSVMMATALPVWGCLGGLKGVALPRPPLASRVTIFADNDESGAGRRYAEELALRLRLEGREVAIAMPSTAGTDFNDLLREVE